MLRAGGDEDCGGLEKPTMDVLKMLADLRQEREHIEEAIMTLERLARGRGRRGGRDLGRRGRARV